MGRVGAPGQPIGWDRLKWAIDVSDQSLVLSTSYEAPDGTRHNVEARIQLHYNDGLSDPPATAEELAVDLRAEAVAAVDAINLSIAQFKADAQAYCDSQDTALRTSITQLTTDAKAYVDGREAVIRADATTALNSTNTAVAAAVAANTQLRTDATAAIAAANAAIAQLRLDANAAITALTARVAALETKATAHGW